MSNGTFFFTDTYCPCLAMTLGDPSGIGPELVAKLLSADVIRKHTNIVLFADSAEAEHGMAIAGLRYPYTVITDLNNLRFERGFPLLYSMDGGAKPFARGVPTAESGRNALDALEAALHFTQIGADAGGADAMLHGPVSTHALRLAGVEQSGASQWLGALAGHAGLIQELSIVDGLWIACVNSHTSAAAVADTINVRSIVDTVGLLSDSLRNAGLERPRIAVCALNPYSGENGICGREELDIIKPALEQARAQGVAADGPFPVDTLFHRVVRGWREYDGVVTMYHEQGQMAARLMGSARGVVVQGGLSVPVVTPAHGTAYGISQKGMAEDEAMLQAFAVTMRLAVRRRAGGFRQSARAL